MYRDRRFKGPIAQFIRDPNYGVQNYVRYVEQNVDTLKKLDHMIVTYEKVRSDTPRSLKTVLEFIGLTLSDDEVGQIAANSTFDRMQAIEREGRYKLDWIGDRKFSGLHSLKMRTGGAESLQEVFTDSDLEFMRRCYETSDIFVKLGYADNQHA